MIAKCIERSDMKIGIEEIIATTDRANHQDLINTLNYLDALVKKYTEDKGVKLVIQHVEEIQELLIPYFKHCKEDCFLAVATFGVNTSLFDIYKLNEFVTNYTKENVLVATPDLKLNEEKIAVRMGHPSLLHWNQ